MDAPIWSAHPAERKGMTKQLRQRAIDTIAHGRPIPEMESGSVPEIYGKSVFSLAVMEERLPKSVFKSIKRTIAGEQPLDPNVADAVAAAMKEWAINKGATHYAHVFFPLTGLTAEKHDSFYNPAGTGETIAEFSGQALIQGEPDASSFPNGGIRETFEARGYTAWDVSSPAYIFESTGGATLCIPTAFIAWTGEALDKKTPVLRSMQALDREARRILKLFGHKQIAPVAATAGPEQEYFLVDRAFYFSRPDLLNAGRTLFGAAPPKGQEFDDHYFGAIPDRVLACMFDVEHELFKLGIPAKTRHNEVAPSQYEIAPVFESANVATDHQQLVMVTLKRVAEKHGFVCLTHEKPFAGVNGSGKHVNFSMGSATQGNLLDPGDTPHENAQFLVFCAAVFRAVHRYGRLLRSVIASAGNDHRLGANEAPPAILSVFLGDQLTDVFEQIKGGGASSSKERGTLRIGVDVLPDLPKDAGDRNRTSPFAFIGNRFEFRAVGSNQSIAGPLVAMNTIVAESLAYCADRLEAADTRRKSDFNEAVQALLRDIITEHGAIIFNGDGYSDEWHAEAERRGLPNLRTTADALPVLVEEEIIELFERFNVLSRRELQSRYEIYLEQYINQINVEARISIEIAQTQILPAAMKYLGQLAETAENLKDIGVEPDIELIQEIHGLTSELGKAVKALKVANETHVEDAQEHADHCRDAVIPAMNKVRELADNLEELVDDDLWPLPTYQEMLFIK